MTPIKELRMVVVDEKGATRTVSLACTSSSHRPWLFMHASQMLLWALDELLHGQCDDAHTRNARQVKLREEMKGWL